MPTATAPDPTSMSGACGAVIFTVLGLLAAREV